MEPENHGSIDDLLTGVSDSQTPNPPEEMYREPEEPEEREAPEAEEETQPEEPEALEDDYGNPKAASKTYTEEEVNERINKAIRDRLSRGQHAQQPTPEQQQQAKAVGFEYDSNSEQDWQQQLKEFIRQTNEELQREQAHKAQQLKEQQAQAVFEDKFQRGMDRFSDFRDVVSTQPITDAMTYALRGVQDPAAFVYAAAKKHSTELNRISQIPDPYAQMVEMGKLEERMRIQKSKTTAPKPLSRDSQDTTGGMVEPKGETIEDLIAHAEAKKRKLLNQRRGR